MQPEDQLIWLLQLLQNSPLDFATLYGIQFHITDMIIIKSGEPKNWFYMNKKFRVKAHDENWLKNKAIHFYLSHPELSNHQCKKVIETDNFEAYPQQQVVKKEDDQFLFYFEQKLSQGKTYRAVSKSVVNELFKNPTEKNDYMNNWIKILSYKEIQNGKNLQLFSVVFNQYSTSMPVVQIFRKKLNQPPLEKEEFSKSENGQKKVLKIEDQTYKSLSSQYQDICIKFSTSLARFIEGKTQKKVGGLQIEFFLNQENKIYFSGLEQIRFVVEEGKEENIDLHSIPIYQNPKKDFWKCPGLYCEQSKDNVFFDENDEQFCLFILDEEQKEDKFVPYKSIFLDLVERYKTIQIIQTLCKLDQYQVSNLPETILFKLRKYYSIGDITASILFKHLKISNFYDQQKVCQYCFHVYNKIDALRNQRLLSKKRKNTNNQLIEQEVNRYLSSYNFQSSQKLHMKNRMSHNFFEKLQKFDNEKKKFFQEFNVSTMVDEKYFQRNHLPRSVSQKNVFSLTQYSNQNFQLPIIHKSLLKDKDDLINKKKYFVTPDQAEALGLKHYLGHVKNLPYSDQGLAISKSSLELNKLQDKIKEIEFLKERMENDKIKKLREEIELVMCTYYGKGKADYERLIDFIDTLKKREQQDLNSNPQLSNDQKAKTIQIVTDKNDFLTEHQRKQKQDKEKKEMEIQETKKSFLELNNTLAQSILRKRLQQTDQSPYSPQKLDNISEDSEIY